MKKVSFKGTVSEYQGQKVNPELSYSGEADQFENISEARQSEFWPGDAEVLKFVNNKLLTNAKSSAYQEVIKPLKEAYESSDDYKWKNLYDSAVAAGQSADAARALASSIVPGASQAK